MQSPYGRQVVLLGGTMGPVDGFLKIDRKNPVHCGTSAQDDTGLHYGPVRRLS